MSEKLLRIFEAIFYLIAAAMIMIFGERSLKTLIAVTGVAIILCSAWIFLCVNKNSTAAASAIACATCGIVFVVFSRFFVNASLLIVGVIFIIKGVYLMFGCGNPLSIADAAAGLAAILSSFVFKKVFIFIFAVCLLINAVIKFLAAAGFLDR